jgi:hypothetical protein
MESPIWGLNARTQRDWKGSSITTLVRNATQEWELGVLDRILRGICGSAVATTGPLDAVMLTHDDPSEDNCAWR